MKWLSSLALALVAVVCPAQGNRVAFDRLQKRLDKAPPGFYNLEQPAQKMEKISEVASLSDRLVQPFIPSLNAISESKIVAKAGELPVVGRPIRSAQTAIGLAAGLSEGVHKVIEADRAWISPMRNAVMACSEMRSHPDISKVADLRDKLQQAQGPTWLCGLACVSREQQINEYCDVLTRLQSLLGKEKSQMVDPVRNTALSIGVLGRELKSIAVFFSDCISDCDAVLKEDPEPSSKPAPEVSVQVKARPKEKPSSPVAEPEESSPEPVAMSSAVSSPAPTQTNWPPIFFFCASVLTLGIAIWSLYTGKPRPSKS